jgi:hypothetical protein
MSLTRDAIDENTTKPASSPIPNDNSNIENITSAIQKLSLSECANTNSGDKSNLFSATNEASSSPSSESNDSSYFSDSNSTTSETSSTSSQDSTDFHIRTLEIRNARLATSLLSLDEDIPRDLDDSIKQLLEKNTRATASPLEYRGSQHYLEYKQQLAAKHASEKKLPRSKGPKAQSMHSRTLPTLHRRYSQ